MLIRENAVAEHEPGARLYDMLCQEPGPDLGGGFPDPGIQPRIEIGELGPQPHQTDPAIYLCHDFQSSNYRGVTSGEPRALVRKYPGL
jgi:hypothetical protein